MPSLPDPDPTAIATALETWFRNHGKDYPWRRTRDPYAILVSEVMLQQTQIATVLERGYYTRWLSQFPDFATLATASETAILTAWEGLGYYRRARNLQKLAQTIIRDHHGHFPNDPPAILALPGISPYTAGALASFAFNLPEPIVDGNVARVLARLFNDPTPIDSRNGSATLWQRARTLVNASTHPSSFNSALMELGQTHCRTGQPHCAQCPIRAHCRATAPATLPIKAKRPTLTTITERVFFHQSPAGILLEQETGSRRTGLWKLPTLPPALPHPPVLLKSQYAITRYRVDLWVHSPPSSPLPQRPTAQFIPPTELPKIPMPSPYRRALTTLLKAQSPFTLESTD
jgi:A/G-specific adenine glycosylase